MTPPRAAAWAVAWLAVPAAARAQSRWERQVQHHLAQAAATLSASRYVAASSDQAGMLDNGETAADTVTLVAGVSYVLVGVCDDDCRSLELGLFAANGYEVDAARGAGNGPIIRVTPRESMRYRVTVRMTGCGMNPCWYSVRVFTRK